MSADKMLYAVVDEVMKEYEESLPEIEIIDDSSDLMDVKTFQLLNELDPRYIKH